MSRSLAAFVLLVLVAAPLAAGCIESGGAPAATASVPRGTTNGSAPIVGSTETHGYLAVRDGTLLAYDLILPGDGSGKWPLLLTYDGYDAGSIADTKYRAEYVPDGYAFMGLNVRGTGCSGGSLDFFEPVEGLDGYDAIEWAAKQSWSDGKVGMIGKSYPGITQLFVAETNPPHLVAAAPGHVYGDIYRDVAYPGGIFNYGFAGLWSFVAQPEPGYAAAIQSGDATCKQNMLQHTATNLPTNAFLQAQEHMFDDDLIKQRSPVYHASNITVPLYLFQSWQDEQVSVRGVDVAENLHTDYWLTLSNGDHGMYRTKPSLLRLHRFFDHYLKGADNGWENEPRVQTWWDADTTTRAPAWTRNFSAWPVTDVAPLRLYLDDGGKLATNAPTSGTADSYVYPGAGYSNGAGYGEYPAQLPINGNTAPENGTLVGGPTRVTYTSAPFASDVLVLGPMNLTFWASSTAPDTDFQATVTELSGGHETYVQKGWLRASHRALDPARSSEYRPIQSHTQMDLLTPGDVNEYNVEIFPVGQAFRAGTQLRVAIEAPSVLPELWGLEPTPLAAVNTILHDAQHPSVLAIPTLAGDHADVPEPACGSLIRQSCA